MNELGGIVSDIKLLEYEDIPCWYELSFSKRPKPTLNLSIHKAFLKEESIPDDCWILKTFGSLGLKDFSTKFDCDFGFNSCLKLGRQADEFVNFQTVLPQVVTWSQEPCKHCGGSGKDEFLYHDKCLNCHGKGHQLKIDYRHAFEISATFAVLSSFLFTTKVDTKSARTQLLQFTCIAHEGLHGGSLSGVYSRTLVRWLKQHYHHQIPEMMEAMQSAWQYMMGRETFGGTFYAGVDYHGGWLNVSCPGDACGLNPDDCQLPEEEERGYRFSCHNVDSPAQQLTLLAALGALHKRVRKETS